MPSDDFGEWAVLLDGPSPTGMVTNSKKRAERIARRWKAKGVHAYVVDMTQTIEEMEPEDDE